MPEETKPTGPNPSGASRSFNKVPPPETRGAESEAPAAEKTVVTDDTGKAVPVLKGKGDAVVKDLLSRLEKNPHAAQQVRVLKVRDSEMFPLAVAELRAACEANPDHPKSQELMRAVRPLPAGQIVTVEKVDLEAVLKNEEVVYIRDRETLPLVSGEEANEVNEVQRKVLKSDPNVAGLVTSPVPFQQ